MSSELVGTNPAAFKAKVALAAVKGDRTQAQLAEQFDSQSNCVLGGATRRWRCRCVRLGGGNGAAPPAVDV